MIQALIAILVPVIFLGIAFAALYKGMPLNEHLKWLSERHSLIWNAGIVFIVAISAVIYFSR